MSHSWIVKMLIVDTLIEVYVKYRQYKALCAKQSENSKKLLTPEDYKKSVAYNKAKCLFNIFFSFLELWKEIFIFNNLLWFYNNYIKKHYKPDILMLVSYSSIGTILSIPMDLFYTFGLEAYFGFNKTTPYTFIKDFVIGFFINLLISYGVSYVIILIMESGISHFYIYIWAFICLCILVAMPIYMKIVATFFNKIYPLEDGELKTEIYALAEKNKFPVTKILVMDESRRSSHSNAFFTGLGKQKNIVLFDTILTQLNNNDILAVLAHELGHWAKNHTIWLMGMAFSNLFAHLFVFNLLLDTYKHLPSSITLLVFLYTKTVASIPLKLLQNSIVRIIECQADRFAIDQGFGSSLKSGLIKMSKENMSAPVNDPWYSRFTYNHPPLDERLQFIDEEMARSAKKEE